MARKIGVGQLGSNFEEGKQLKGKGGVSVKARERKQQCNSNAYETTECRSAKEARELGEKKKCSKKKQQKKVLGRRRWSGNHHAKGGT